MTTCRDTRRALELALALEDLPREAARHADDCASCRAELERYRAYAVITTRARRAVEAGGDLPPSSWVRIRDAVESRPRPSFMSRYGLAMAGFAAVVAAVAWGAAGTGGDGGHDAAMTTAHAIPRVALPSAPAVTTAPAPARESDGTRLAIAAGDVIDGAGGRTITAFGRHHVSLAAGTEVRVVAWSPQRMTLELIHGSVTSDVTRAVDEDVYEIRTAEATVSVLGTVFTVSRALDTEVTEVAVARGKVAVTDSAGAVEFLEIGQRATLGGPSTAAAEVPETPEAPAREPRRSAIPKVHEDRVIEIEVPSQAAVQPQPGWDGERALRAIDFAIVRGRCDVALKAIETLEQSVKKSDLPRARIDALRARCAP